MEQEQDHEKSTSEMDLAFFGVISASFSHEINNVISIIREVSGLLADLSAAAEQGRPVPNEKLASMARNMSSQTERGEKLIKSFNRFAHSADIPSTEKDTRVILEALTALSQRFAARKKVSLRLDCQSAPMSVNCNPFKAMHAAFLCIQGYISSSAEGAEVSVSASPYPGGNMIIISGTAQGSAPVADDKLRLLELLMNETGGEYTFETAADGSSRFALLVP